jgi:hypothetical protein
MAVEMMAVKDGGSHHSGRGDDGSQDGVSQSDGNIGIYTSIAAFGNKTNRRLNTSSSIY